MFPRALVSALALVTAFVPWASAQAPPECSDGVDNDGDGGIDYPADPDCSSPDGSEFPTVPPPACSDGWDNDGDGLFDFPEDHGCDSPADNDEWAPSRCSDGVDNDGDGYADEFGVWNETTQGYDLLPDPGCGYPDDNDETDPFAVPQNVWAEPGPHRTRMITLHWDEVEGTQVYHVMSTCGEIVHQDDTPGDGEVIFNHEEIETGAGEYGSRTCSYRVAAADYGGRGESQPSPAREEANTTSFLACEPVGGFVCIGVHPQVRLGSVIVHSPSAEGDAIPVTLFMGRIRLEAAGTYVEQATLSANVSEEDPLGPLDGAQFGPVTVHYQSEGVFGGGEPGLYLSTQPDPVNETVIGSLFAGRAWLYLAEDKVTDIPMLIFLPLSGGCNNEERYNGPNDLARGWVEDPQSCHVTPSAGAPLAFTALVFGLAVLRRLRLPN